MHSLKIKVARGGVVDVEGVGGVVGARHGGQQGYSELGGVRTSRYSPYALARLLFGSGCLPSTQFRSLQILHAGGGGPALFSVDPLSAVHWLLRTFPQEPPGSGEYKHGNPDVVPDIDLNTSCP